MSDPDWLGGIFADDALLDRLAARDPAGDEPLALVLGSLASFVDEPVGRHRAVTARRGPSRARRVAVAGLMAVVMSGAGFAAALSLPDRPGQQEPPARSTVPTKPVRGGTSGATTTGTPRPGGPSPTTVPADAVRSTSPARADAAGVVPSGPPATNRGALPPTPARDGGEPPGLVAGPGTPAATPPSESDRSHQRGRPTTLPTPPGKGRTAHPPGGPSRTTPPGHGAPSTPPTG